MKVVYIAGSFRGANAWEVAKNVRRAEHVAYEVAQLGAMPLCPHANTAHFDGTLTPEFWIEGTTELMRRCDAVVLVDMRDMDSSAGTRGEIAEATRLKLPVFPALELLATWLGKDVH